MSFPTPWDIARNEGSARGWSSFIKYGHNGVATTTFEPINTGGFLQLPFPSDAQQLRVVSDDANDTAAGTGARSVLLNGLDAEGFKISEVVQTNGITAGPLSTRPFWRLIDAGVLDSGTYGTALVGSHAGNITIEDGGGIEWGLIDINGFPHSRMQSNWLTVPKGQKYWVSSITAGADANKLADFKVIARFNAQTETAPFPAMLEIFELTGIEAPFQHDFAFPFGPLPEFTDIGFIGRVQIGTGALSADAIIAVKEF